MPFNIFIKKTTQFIAWLQLKMTNLKNGKKKRMTKECILFKFGVLHYFKQNTSSFKIP